MVGLRLRFTVEAVHGKQNPRPAILLPQSDTCFSQFLSQNHKFLIPPKFKPVLSGRGDYYSTEDEKMTNPNQQADMKMLRAKQCSNEAVKEGAKAAAIACVASAIPTMLGARAIPWARANLNHAAQALIISTISGSAYFIVADKTILKSARRNSFHDQMENHGEYCPF